MSIIPEIEILSIEIYCENLHLSLPIGISQEGHSILLKFKLRHWKKPNI